jgi:hypothetical protein
LRRKPKILGIFLILTVTWFQLPGFAYGDMTWTIRPQLNLGAPPLDVSESADGKWLFILTPGEVLIYSVAENAVKHRVPVDNGYDRLIHSPRSNTLILTSRSQKILRVIQLETIAEFDLSGLPFKGRERAPVTIAVFSDYQ